ncbi:MAG: tetratricopeptide repeat protein [Flavisolibacter sp.]
MKQFVAILCCFISLYSHCQLSELDLNWKASDFFDESRIDSALYYFTQLKDFSHTGKAIFSTEAYCNNKIAACYLVFGDTDKAEKLFWENISRDSVLYHDRNADDIFDTYFYLAKIRYVRGQYRSALECLNRATARLSKSREHNRLDNVQPSVFNWVYGKSELKAAFGRAQCYQQLDKKDSLLLELSPLMAVTEEPRFVQLFIKTAFEFYGKKRVKAELLNGLEHSYYMPRFSYDGLYNECFFVNAESYVPFFNTKILFPVPEHGVEVKYAGDIPKDCQKETLIKNFKNTAAYVLIVEQ